MATNSRLKAAQTVARLLDNRFQIGPIKFGFDPIINIVPGLGDVLGMLFSLYLVWIAVQMELPKRKILWMIWHIFIDFIIGIIPFFGTIGDIFYKANEENLKIIEQNSRLTK